MAEIKNFQVKKISVQPFTETEHEQQKDRNKFTTFLLYNKETFTLMTDEIILDEGGVLPYINPKTHKPFNYFEKDDPRRFLIMIPLDQELNCVIQSIDKNMA